MTIADLISYDTKENELYLDYKRRVAREARERDKQSIHSLRNAEPEPGDKPMLLSLDSYLDPDANPGMDPQNNGAAGGNELLLDDLTGDNLDDCFIMFDEQHSNDYIATVKYPTKLGINYRTRSKHQKETQEIRSRIRINRLAKNYEKADDSMFLVTHGRQWKLSEIQRLIELIRRFGMNLDAITLHFPTRPKRCIAAYFKRLYKGKHSGLLRALEDFNARMADIKECSLDSCNKEDCFDEEIQQVRRLMDYERERRTITIGSEDMDGDDHGEGTANLAQQNNNSDHVAEVSNQDNEEPISNLDILEGFLNS